MSINPIIIENRRLGSLRWQQGLPGFQVADDLHSQIKGYASATSVNHGETITFYVSVNPTQTYTLDIYRLGWYDGLGGRLLKSLGPLDGFRQPPAVVDGVTGMATCAWASAYTLEVPMTWTSGVYVVQLTNSQNYQNYILFVVRDDARQADLLFQQSVTTYQAYNNYVGDGTFKSLYDYNSTASRRAHKVSFDRPYNKSANDVSGGAGDFFSWDVQMVRWLEKSGYDVAYSTNVDTHVHGERLLNYKGFLSVGHDEYWSQAMYDQVQAAREAGVHLGFFGADDIGFRVRFESSAGGAPNRVLVCYKDEGLDPVSPPTIGWGRELQQALMGVHFGGMVDPFGPQFPYTVKNSRNWVYRDTGFRDGDQAAHIVGYEFDNADSGVPPPANIAYDMLSHSLVVQTDGAGAVGNSVIYQAPSGAWVFAAGTIEWAFGLDSYGESKGRADARIQRMTANILNRFVGGP